MKQLWLVLSLSGLITSAAAQVPALSPPFSATEAFAHWLGQQRRLDQLRNPSSEALATGLSLVQQRNLELRALMETNPAQFLLLAMPAADRDQLPLALQPLIERRTKGRGFFGVYCAGFRPDQGEGAPAAGTANRRNTYGHEVRLDGVNYRAFVIGEWRKQKTLSDAAIEGVVLGDSIVLADAPIPQQKAPDAGWVSDNMPNKSGPNTLLYMIARFSDEAVDPIGEATVLSQMQTVSNFWLNASYGIASIRGLVNATQAVDIIHITLPQPMSYGPTYNNNFSQLLADSRNAAAAQGYFYTNYNLDALATSSQGFSYAGRSYVGSQGTHWVAPYTTLRTAGHELGHNLGLWHANYWRTDSTLPLGKDSNPGGYVADIVDAEWIEYGHYFSVMSGQYGAEWDDPAKPIYNPVEKSQLGWLTGTQVQYITNSGTYRLFRHDARTTIGTPRGLRIETPATDYTGYGRRYWLSYRYAPWNTASNWFHNGVEVDVAEATYSSDGSILLDMTPYTADQSSPFYDPRSPPVGWWTIDNSDKMDGALIVGRTYNDRNAGIHITPIDTGSNGPGEEFIDLVINLGMFPSNRAPVISELIAITNQAAVNQPVNFIVTASDPDGDTLAYAWDFGQPQVWTASGLNNWSATRSWSGPGQYRVTITVSDMKGGVASASQIITVGSPADVGQIWGRVVWAGQPVYGARVWSTVGSTIYQAWTDGDGSYELAGLASTNNYTVNCQAPGLTLNAQFTNPLSLASGNVFGADFYANQILTNPGPAQIFAVSPYWSQVMAGQAIRFHADGWDTNGNRISVSPTWSVSSGGTIDSTGLFSATLPGGAYKVTAAVGSLSATGFVWVLPPTPSLTITVQSTNKVYGAALPAFTVLYSGFTNGDTPASLSSPPVVTTTATAASSPGTYPIHVSGAVDTNYAISFVDGTLAILPGTTSATVSSSANPSLPGQAVSFGVTIDPVPPAFGLPGGIVQFQIDGTSSGPAMSLGGGTANYTPAALAHGTHSVAVQYFGDGNFAGTINFLSPSQLINTPPVAGSVVLECPATNGVKISAAELLSSVTDADGDSITLIGVNAASIGGGTVATNSGWIFYTPPPDFTNSDAFNYTIGDGLGAPVNGTATVSIKLGNSSPSNLAVVGSGDGTNLLRGDGIPMRTYQIQFADDPGATNWMELGSASADPSGILQFTDSAALPQRRYRSSVP